MSLHLAEGKNIKIKKEKKNLKLHSRRNVLLRMVSAARARIVIQIISSPLRPRMEHVAHTVGRLCLKPHSVLICLKAYWVWPCKSCPNEGVGSGDETDSRNVSSPVPNEDHPWGKGRIGLERRCHHLCPRQSLNEHRPPESISQQRQWRGIVHGSVANWCL